MIDTQNLHKLPTLIRYYILVSTTEAKSGHPTSSLSAVELMTTLMFGGFFKAKLDDPNYHNNDRLIFSKGHASPLFYAIYGAAGKLTEEELKTLRKYDSPLEGHPTMRFPYTEAATGSLGQGLSVGLGMALNAKYLDKLPYKTFVLLGDSEMAEGSNWEAIQVAAHYKLDNLIGIIDTNRLGQRGETMYGHDVEAYAKRVGAFGWETIVIDGHNLEDVSSAFEKAQLVKEKPMMIIAKTQKGKGVSFLEGQEGWHGKALSKEECEKALSEIGEVNTQIIGVVSPPELIEKKVEEHSNTITSLYKSGELVATRKAYGDSIAQLTKQNTNIVVLDAEVSNSTFADSVKKETPDQFFEMFIAEQNMVGTALGLSRRGKVPFISTFAAFFTRAFDQIRMSQYSDSNIKFVGSHAGASIGVDGSSQMGLEDIAMFRTVQDCVVLYPSDAFSTAKLVEESAKHYGNVYIRTTREATELLYSNEDEFHIGGSKVLKSSDNDVVTVIGAGITLHEALEAYELLAEQGIKIRVIDLYSIKPIDTETLLKASNETNALIVVEDHYSEGGICEAVRSALANESGKVYSLAVIKMPRSGQPNELLAYEEIDAEAIVKKVKEVVIIEDPRS